MNSSLPAPLGDFPILAKCAPHIAADAGKRIGGGAGQEVEERFLFDRIKPAHDHAAIRYRIELAAKVHADTTDSLATFSNETFVRA
jgi:hypothetical protein